MKGVLRQAALTLYRSLPVPVRRAFFAGHARYCPVCDSAVGRFVEAGVNALRPDARCPVCGSEERQRLAHVYATRRAGILGPGTKRVLHMAPSACLERRLPRIPGVRYTAADLDPGPGQLQADITALPFEDASFEIVWCSHVLEHVVDDRAGMREMLRVLVPGGHAIVQVPVSANHTIEDASVTDPERRLELYGQRDHVRRYGPDVLARLRDAGFEAEALGPEDLLTEDEPVLMAVPDDEVVYACVRPRGRDN
ncbi:MAG: methyltransferase domain-containing protein [Candidatus Eisenbacteria bacterium]|nr:methyltransferase domain-containing protein [Candidatus Eisenbacteria bacterium]